MEAMYIYPAFCVFKYLIHKNILYLQNIKLESTLNGKKLN